MVAAAQDDATQQQLAATREAKKKVLLSGLITALGIALHNFPGTIMRSNMPQKNVLEPIRHIGSKLLHCLCCLHGHSGYCNRSLGLI